MRRRDSLSKSNSGMSLLEMVVAMLMIVLFTGVVVSVLEISSRFLGNVEIEKTAGKKNKVGISNGVLIDLHEIQLVFDQIVAVLSQPGISRERLFGKNGEKQIAFPLGTNTAEACTKPLVVKGKLDLNMLWNLSGPVLSFRDFPAGYSICIWQTSLNESELKSLAIDRWPSNKEKAGIYILQALPLQADAAKLPTRRLFCRPRPYCLLE